MRGKPKQITEVEVLENGLKHGAGLDVIPTNVASVLTPMTDDELVNAFIEGCNIVSFVMATKGWILMELKRRAGHGDFKTRLGELGINYRYANYCMNIARAISSHPTLAQIPNSHLVRRITQLPEDMRAEIAKAIKDDPQKAKSLADAWKRHKSRALFPHELATIGIDLRPQKPPKDRSNVPDIVPSQLSQLLAQALSALNQIADLAIPPAEHEQAKDAYHRRLLRAFDQAVYNLTDPLHETVPFWERNPMADDMDEYEDPEEGVLQ